MDTVIIKSANRERIAAAVQSYVTQLYQAHAEIEQVIWFGSWITGIPTPGSDVDLCLVVSSSDLLPREPQAFLTHPVSKKFSNTGVTRSICPARYCCW